MNIDDQVKKKEKELQVLKSFQKKEKLLKDGVIEILENNILKDVISRERKQNLLKPIEGKVFIVNFKLNSVDFEVETHISLADELINYRDNILKKVSEKITEEIFTKMFTKK